MFLTAQKAQGTESVVVLQYVIFFSLKDHTFYHLKTDLETWRGLSTFGGSGDFRLCLPGDLEFIKTKEVSLSSLSQLRRDVRPL